jgi:TetR/AcrR family transcriptional regulator, cholesterol catabolism regulator
MRPLAQTGETDADTWVSPYQRRQRIMRAALTLALAGGLETMQIRDVAAAAQVSTRTVYNHFPSQEYLLLAALTEASRQTWMQAGRRASRRTTPARKVKVVLEEATSALVAQPELARGLVRAMTCGQPAIAPLLADFDTGMRNVIADALSGGAPTPADLDHARLIQQAWFTAMFSWATGLHEVEGIRDSVDVALELIRR